jgi:RHS repeat-associated protein
MNDPETDLVYMQPRYYDPVAGRFLSIDPVVTDANNGDSFNRYAYAANNPYKYNYNDPDGRAIETPWDMANVAMDIISLSKNLATGNYGGAAVDAVVVEEAVGRHRFASALACLRYTGRRVGSKSLHQNPRSRVQARIAKVELFKFCLCPGCRCGSQFVHAKGGSKPSSDVSLMAHKLESLRNAQR